VPLLPQSTPDHFCKDWQSKSAGTAGKGCNHITWRVLIHAAVRGDCGVHAQLKLAHSPDLGAFTTVLFGCRLAHITVHACMAV
jgi:hypothetical protein